VGTCWRAKAAALGAPSTPELADASTQKELLKGEAAEQISDCRKVLRPFSWEQVQAADLPAKGVPRWRTSCSRWLSCRSQFEDCVTSRSLRRSQIACSKSRLQ